MKRTSLLFSLILSASAALAQQSAPAPGQGQQTSQAAPKAKGEGQMNGVITDATTGEPVAFATVTLLTQKGGQILDGTICDEKGRFSLSKIATGDYAVSISFIGYETQVLENIKIVSGGPAVNLAGLKLNQTAKTLQEVTVTGERDLVEHKIDRMVYNAEKDISNAGGNAGDVLRKVPQVIVDLDGNVQLRGSSNIRVLINNKPSSIMAGSVADALKQIPSDMIKSVEVITSPSAKYDAEGTAGIINIITKKNNLQGVSGSVNASAGTLASNYGASVNYRRNKIGFNLNAGSHMFGVRGTTILNRNEYVTNPATGERTRNTLFQDSDFHNFGGSRYLQFGSDYDFNKQNNLNASIRLSKGRFTNENDLFSSFQPYNSTPVQHNRDINNRNDNMNIDLNLGYTLLFAKPQQELTILGLYTRNNRDNTYHIDQTTVEQVLNYREKNTNESVNTESTVQIDYVHPLNKKQILETGVKGILRNVTSDYQVYNSNGEQDFMHVPSRSDVFEYDQNVVASYVSYGFNLADKYTFKIGTRYEHTFIDADFKGTGLPFGTDYQNVIPNFMVARDLKENQKLRMSFSRRIQRPMIFYLNPNVNSSDARNIFYGNPNLDPEITNAYELGYNTFFKAGSVNASLYWRQTNNAIESVRFPGEEEGVIETTFRNIAENNTVGLSLFGSVKIKEKFTLSGNTNFFYISLESKALNTSNSNVQANFNLDASYKFTKGWSAQAFGFYNTPRAQLQGRVSGMRYYNLAVKKEILNKKGSISMGLDNFLEKSTLVRNTFATDDFDFDSKSYFNRRGVRVSFSYQFGKMKFGPQRQKKSIRNDDVKQGDGQ